MKRIWGVVLGSSLIAACGGGNKTTAGASSPTPAAGGSQLSLDIPANQDQGTPAGKLDLSGPAFSQYDPDAKALLIYVLDPTTQPAPSCDTVGLAAMMKQKSGTVAALVIKDFAGSASKMQGALAMFVQGDASKLQTAPTAMLDATTIDITSYDAKTIEANVTTGASKSVVTGKIHGTVCPNTSMQKQAEQVQADQMAKMQANGGAGFGQAPSAPSSGASLLVPMDDQNSTTVPPTGFAKLDPKTKTLALLVGVAAGDPISCDTFAKVNTSTSDSGGALLVATNVTSHKPGSYAVVVSELVARLPNKSPAARHGTITVSAFDDQKLTADLATAGSELWGGHIDALKVCPDGPSALPPVPKNKSSKKKK